MNFLFQKLLGSAFYIILVGLIVGFVFALIPQSFFNKNFRKFRLLEFEQDGKFYSKYFKINVWKDKLPQFSELTKFGFNKASLNTVSSEYLKTFYVETMRAELSHWFLILVTPVYLFFSEKILLPLVIFGNIFGNLPFIMIQRYNRGRILKLLNHLKKVNKAN